MSQRDDIEFDFFEEPATQETAPRRRGGTARRVVRLAGRRYARREHRLAPAASWASSPRRSSSSSCSSSGSRAAATRASATSYRDYMTDMGQVAEDSEQVGRQLNTLLTTPGIRQQQLQNRLDQLAQQQLQGVTRARELSPPGPLREEHQPAVISLEQRVSGLRGSRTRSSRPGSERPGDEAGELLAAQMRRLVASDVMWEDLFPDPGGRDAAAGGDLRRRVLPRSPSPRPIWRRPARWRRSSIAFAARRRAAPRPACTAATSSRRRALPSGQVLKIDEDNTIVATADLAFEVTVENSGDSQEVASWSRCAWSRARARS